MYPAPRPPVVECQCDRCHMTLTLWPVDWMPDGQPADRLRASLGGVCPLCLNAVRIVEATGVVESRPLIPPR